MSTEPDYAAEVLAFLDALPNDDGFIAAFNRGGVSYKLTPAALRAVLAELEQLRDDRAVTLDGLLDAAHRRRPGFDEDVRAVAALLVALDVTLTNPPAGLERRVQKLRARFADRIAALREREQEGGAR